MSDLCSLACKRFGAQVNAQRRNFRVVVHDVPLEKIPTVSFTKNEMKKVDLFQK